ncbi:unnamed protein product [Clonostachys byssicola]|uniref:Uncharacterized protein n=1 Tax=Clonostachys byssicola TaxID=160290 RepID=A0A9N9UV52_9HYPO|nr:unnamed protein product [Clonostachys byssicola]
MLAAAAVTVQPILVQLSPRQPSAPHRPKSIANPQYHRAVMCRVTDSTGYPTLAKLATSASAKKLWFQYMLVDEAYFHCFVALSEACVDLALGKKRESCSSEYRHHLATALRLINSNLSSHEAVSDTNIAGVIALCDVGLIRANLCQARAYFEGLCRMIKVRGGTGQLQGNPALLQKAQSIDIDLALLGWCPAQLSKSAKELDQIVPIFSVLEVTSPLVNAVRNTDQDVFKAAQDVMKMSRIFNSSVASRKLGADAFHDIVISLCYRLLGIGAISGASKLSNPVARAAHLGLIAFMTTFLPHLSHGRDQMYHVLSRKYKAALSNAAFRKSIDPATHLWLLMVAGLSVLEDGEFSEWLAPRISEVLDQFGMDEWSFARRLMGKYPWVNSVHDTPGAAVWQKCFPTSTAQNN